MSDGWQVVISVFLTLLVGAMFGSLIGSVIGMNSEASEVCHYLNPEWKAVEECKNNPPWRGRK